MQFLESSAYVFISLEGKNFCAASVEVTGLLNRHLGSFTALTGLSFIYTSIGKILVSLLTAFFGYLILKKQHPDV